MNANCEIIEDLLPLYADGVCSAQSRKAVEQHMLECEKCRNAFARAQAMPAVHVAPQQPAKEKAVKNGFRKIRMRWLASVLAVAVVIGLLFLGWNQYHSRGIHYTNIHEYKMGKQFMQLLSEGKYEKAYKHMDIAGLKEAWLEHWFDEAKLTNLEADGLAKFCEYGEKLEEAGGIGHYEYIGISMSGVDDDGKDVYRLEFKASICGKLQIFHIDVCDDGIRRFGGGGSFLDDPLAQFSIWTEYLWQDYAGCYFDPELKTYVYYEE